MSRDSFLLCFFQTKSPLAELLKERSRHICHCFRYVKTATSAFNFFSKTTRGHLLMHLFDFQITRYFEIQLPILHF